MLEENINYQYITEFINQNTPDTTPFLAELEIYAKENFIPIINRETRRFLEMLLKLKQPKRILEIGTAIGYSSLVFEEATGALVDTIEIDDKAAGLALKNIQKAEKSEKITVYHGDALTVLKVLKQESYDAVFIDAAKGKYPEFFRLCFPLLKQGGLLICDNILYKGMVANEALIPRKKRALVHKLQRFITYLMRHTNLTSSIVPIGDGLIVSIKRSATC